MTAVETQNNDSLMRPTDLSLKGCLNNKYSKESSNSPSPNSIPLSMINEQKVSFIGKSQHHWRNKIKVEPVTMPSPMTLTYATAGVATSMAPTMPIDSVTSLVMLESLLSQYHRYSPPAVFDPRTAQTIQRSRMGSDSSNEKAPISQPILDAAKGLTELQHSGIHNDKRFVHNSNHTSNNDNPTATTSKFKTCKRKGGWKFHDFSDESEAPGKRKRTYCQNRLESDILQLYQDRVTIKEVPTIANSSKVADRLVIIEPTQIVDADLIRYNTSLRIVLDKKKMTYRLQVLPHTIEEGPLSNKTQVLQAVSKMLGQTGAVLCPGIVHARIPSVMDDSSNSWSTNRSQNKRSDNRVTATKMQPLVTSDSSSEGEMNFNNEKYRASWKIFRNTAAHSARSLTPPENASRNCSTVTPSGKLSTSHSDNVLSKLMTLNKEVTESQKHTSAARHTNQNNSTDCLLWHVPTPGSKIRKGTWPEEAKWCRNCLRKMRGPSKRIEYPRVSST